MTEYATFYGLLFGVNFLSFLPMFLLNVREQPNPLGFLFERRYFNKNKLKLFYSKLRFTDPFRINFDYTFSLLLISAFQLTNQWSELLLTIIFVVSTLEIVYATIMHSVFRRAPAIVSDLSLIRAGLSIANQNRKVLLVLACAATIILFYLAVKLNEFLLSVPMDAAVSQLLFALLLVPPCLYHWKAFNYSDFLSRTVYSAGLHLYRNFANARKYGHLFERGSDFFTRHNQFRNVNLHGSPNILILCIESYGSAAFESREVHSVLRPQLESFSNLSRKGLYVASNLSAAPIYTGGSWLSYASFTYGIRIDNLQIYDGLFLQKNAFQAYESLFHVLRRNKYRNYLLCPLGGIDRRDVDWDSLKRCFQSHHLFDFESLSFRGPCYRYLGQKHIYSAPDQYALNFAYTAATKDPRQPFSLFFCTLNSHYPWNSPGSAVANWQELNEQSYPIEKGKMRSNLSERYASAIRYQLDYLVNFLGAHVEDNLLTVVFGDHQPPFVSGEATGTLTPVHVLSRNKELIQVFESHGFVPSADLDRAELNPIRHEGFLSLLMKAMDLTYGSGSGETIKYLPTGSELFDAS